MNDCRRLLCERVNIPNESEYDEYSIFIISTSGYNSFFHIRHNDDNGFLRFSSSSSSVRGFVSYLESSSRLVDPSEYLFDILSECVRSTMTNYHFIVKRMLWFHLPLKIDAQQQNKSDGFIDFMYHQLVPELLEGTMIVINNNHLPDQSMVDKRET
jgi:hypothetical protein